MIIAGGLNEWGSLVAVGLGPYRTTRQDATQSIQEPVGLAMSTQENAARCGAVQRPVGRALIIQEEG